MLPTHNGKFTKIKFAILIFARTLLLCRTWKPHSLVCPRRMCQSLVVSSFSIAVEASPIIMLLVNLYKFSVPSPLRIIIEPLVTLIPPSAPENLYPRAFKACNGEDSSLNPEHAEHSWGFEHVHQTSSYECCWCQQSYTQCHFPSE